MTVAPALFHVESPYVVHNLKDKLAAAKAEEIGHLTNAADWADFRYRVGRILGIQEAINIIEDMEKRENR